MQFRQSPPPLAARLGPMPQISHSPPKGGASYLPSTTTFDYYVANSQYSEDVSPIRVKGTENKWSKRKEHMRHSPSSSDEQLEHAYQSTSSYYDRERKIAEEQFGIDALFD